MGDGAESGRVGRRCHCYLRGGNNKKKTNERSDGRKLYETGTTPLMPPPCWPMNKQHTKASTTPTTQWPFQASIALSLHFSSFLSVCVLTVDATSRHGNERTKLVKTSPAVALLLHLFWRPIDICRIAELRCSDAPHRISYYCCRTAKIDSFRLSTILHSSFYCCAASRIDEQR